MSQIKRNDLITIEACTIHFKIPPKKRFLSQLKSDKINQTFDENSPGQVKNKQGVKRLRHNSQNVTKINDVNKFAKPTRTPRTIIPENSMQDSKNLLSVNMLPEIMEKNKSYSNKKLQKNAFSTDKLKSLQRKNKEVKFILKDNALLTQKYQNYVKLKRKPLFRHYTTEIKASISKDFTCERDTKKINSLSASLQLENSQFKLQQKQKKSPPDNQDRIIKNNKTEKNNNKLIREEFTSLINLTNKINVENEKHFFNAYIEKGNNGIMVRQLIKNRWWWHLCNKQPVKETQQDSQASLKSTSNTMPLIDNNNRKINLYWSQWLNRSFVENLEPYNVDSQRLKTVYEEYSPHSPHEELKYSIVNKITDYKTFNEIKNNISLRNGNYFKSSSPKPFSSLQNSPSLLSKKSLVNSEQLSPCKDLTKIKVSQNIKIHNHVIGCLELHSKTLLFKNFSSYLTKKRMDPFQFIPLTFYVQNQEPNSLNKFLVHFDKEQNKDSIWILKPGENSNRGFGITIHKQKAQIENEIEKRLKQRGQNDIDLQRARSKNKSVIIQKYISDCFLINNRKFDFRCYILLTTVNGHLKGYWYGNGYIRTSSQQYDLSNIEDRMIHLTNDAVQSKNSSFGKFQDYNKMSFESFRRYIEKKGIEARRFDEALERMRNIAYYLIASVSGKIGRSQHTFELFGLDFMMDKDLKPYLIEANSNPCLDTKGPVLTKLIRSLIDNVIMTAIDPLFPPPMNVQAKRQRQNLSKDYFQTNMFELIFSDDNNSAESS